MLQSLCTQLLIVTYVCAPLYSFECEAKEDIKLPEHLITPEEMDALVAQQQPHYVKLDGTEMAGPQDLPPTLYSQVGGSQGGATGPTACTVAR